MCSKLFLSADAFFKINGLGKFEERFVVFDFSLIISANANEEKIRHKG